MRHINQAGIDLIKLFEGYRSESYRCSGNTWTIGYGHTRNVRPGMRVTQGEAERLLREDLRDAELSVSQLIDVPLTNNQFAVLVSFVFNFGHGALRTSTLRRLLNQGDYDSVPEQLRRWVYAGGKRLTGLERRREAEIELFQQPDQTEPGWQLGPGWRLVEAPHYEPRLRL